MIPKHKLSHYAETKDIRTQHRCRIFSVSSIILNAAISVLIVYGQTKDNFLIPLLI
jgi:hypothetical protein